MTLVSLIFAVLNLTLFLFLSMKRFEFFFFFFFFFFLHLEKVTQFYVELISCDHLCRKYSEGRPKKNGDVRYSIIIA